MVGKSIPEVLGGESTNTEDGSRIDIITGGFPCQPFSQAGRRQGTADDRYLWPEMLRVIREFHPRWVIGENVGGLVTWSEGLVLEQVHLDLEGEGYEVQAFIIPAVSLNAPHKRDRVWIVAHSSSSEHRGRRGKVGEADSIQSINRAKVRTRGSGGANQDATDTRREHGEQGRSEGLKHDSAKRSSQATETQRFSETWNQNWLEVATRLCRVDDGVPRRMDRNPRLKALGNAIVPQVAEEIMRAISLT